MKKLLAVFMLLLTLSLIGCSKQAEQTEVQEVSVETAEESNTAQSIESVETPKVETSSYVTFRQEIPAKVIGVWPTSYGQYFMRIEKHENTATAAPRVFDYTSSEKFANGQEVKMTLNVYDEVVGLSPA